MNIKELGQLVNGIIEERDDASQTMQKIRFLRDAIEKKAMEETGCTQELLNDESKEETAVVRYFYSTMSSLYSKVLIEAAQEQYYVREWM